MATRGPALTGKLRPNCYGKMNSSDASARVIERVWAVAPPTTASPASAVTTQRRHHPEVRAREQAVEVGAAERLGVRCFARAGFRAAREVDTPDGRALLMYHDRPADAGPNPSAAGAGSARRLGVPQTANRA